MALKLASFSITNAIVSPDGKPTVAFLRWINDAVRNIVATINDQGQLQQDIVSSLEKAGIAITTANEAKALAEQNLKATSLANSYVSPTDVLSAMLSGSTATITVEDHTRMYGDGTSVSVKGAAITGLAVSTTYFVVYQDADHKGGTESYTTITDSTQAGQSGSQHLVGSITTPATGDTQPSQGTTTSPPGVAGLSQQKRQQIEDAANGGANN